MSGEKIKSIKRKFVDGIIVNTISYTEEPEPKLTPLELANELLKLTDKERLEVFSYFCTACGSDNRSCQCQNDE